MKIDKAMGGVFDFISAMASPDSRDFRESAITDKIDEVVIDTACPSDTGKWETGIEIDNEWIIVEQYKDKKSAISGHKKYMLAVKKGKRDFKDIDMWGLNE